MSTPPLGIYYADTVGFVGECFCVYDDSGETRVSGILRGSVVTGILKDSKFDVGTDVLEASGTTLMSTASTRTYALQLAATASQCLDLSYTGLYVESDPTDPDSPKRAVLVANGYFAETPGDSLLKATVIQVLLGNMLTQESPSWRLEWDDQKDEMMRLKSSAAAFENTHVGSLGEKNWGSDWDLQVWATAADDFGIVFSYTDETAFVASIPGKKPLEHWSWNVTNRRNYSLVKLGTALSNGHGKHGLFIGEWWSSNITYTISPADSPIAASMDSSGHIIPPATWFEEATKDLASRGVKGYVTDPIVDGAERKVGYQYLKDANMTPDVLTVVAAVDKMEVRFAAESFSLVYKGKINQFPVPGMKPAPPAPGGGGGGGEDNTGLMVALLLGIVGYALIK